MSRQLRPLAERIAERSRVVPETGCIEWVGRLGRNGYGQIRVGDKRPVVHRAAWELVNGPIPEGMQLDHLCRNRSCLNLAHLAVVTSRENTLRGDTIPARYLSRTSCGHGHPFTPENTYIRKGGARICRTCQLAATAESKRRRRAKSA